MIFFGTPEPASAVLEELVLKTSHSIVGVVTKPDKPRGRGQKSTGCPVKNTALRLGLAPIWTPETLAGETLAREIRSLNADAGIVVAYGRILPEPTLGAARLGFINLHYSLLPKLRGAAPVEFALLEGFRETGCTTFWLEKSCDTGDILLQEAVPIPPQETAPELEKRLTETGKTLVVKTLRLLEMGQAPRVPQDHGQATYTRILRKEDGDVDFEKEEAAGIERKVRAFQQWPRVNAVVFGKKIKILTAEARAEEISAPVQIEKGAGFVLKCARGNLLVTEVQPDGGRPMSAWSFIQGARPNS